MDFKVLRETSSHFDWNTVEKAFDKFKGKNHADLVDLMPEDCDKIGFILALFEMVDEGMLKVAYRVKKGNKVIEKDYDEPTDIPDMIEFEGNHCSLGEFDLVSGFSW